MRAAALSLVPGLGHWVVGKRWRAGALFLVDGGLIVSIFFFKSSWKYELLFLAYFATMIPAVIETYALADEGVPWFSRSKPYILIMLFLSGLSATPLLWESTVFSKRSKISISTVFFIFEVIKLLILGAALRWILNHF